MHRIRLREPWQPIQSVSESWRKFRRRFNRPSGLTPDHSVLLTFSPVSLPKCTDLQAWLNGVALELVFHPHARVWQSASILNQLDLHNVLEVCYHVDNPELGDRQWESSSADAPFTDHWEVAMWIFEPHEQIAPLLQRDHG